MDVIGLMMLLKDLYVITPLLPFFFCDNLSTIAIFTNPVFHSRTKHVAVDFYFVWERVQNKELKVQYIPSSQH